MSVKSRIALVTFVAPIALSVCGQVQAIPVLSLSNNTGDIVIVEDGGVGDLNPLEGVVTFMGTVGTPTEVSGWDVIVTTGLSKPQLGSSSEPILHLGSLSASSIAGGTLSVAFTDTDFAAKQDARGMATIGGFSSGIVSYQAFMDDANSAFGQSHLLGSLGPYSGGFSGSAGSVFSAAGLYSLTLLVDVTHAAGLQHSSFDAVLQVPEPGTIGLLGAGLLVLGASAARRRRTTQGA